MLYYLLKESGRPITLDTVFYMKMSQNSGAMLLDGFQNWLASALDNGDYKEIADKVPPHAILEMLYSAGLSKKEVKSDKLERFDKIFGKEDISGIEMMNDEIEKENEENVWDEVKPKEIGKDSWDEADEEGESDGL